MTKHTPSPWKIGGLWNDNVFHPTDRDPVFICAFDHERGRGLTEESQANQALIAAAPEMLEALELITRHLNINNLPVDDMRKVERAIRKAKGE